MVERLLAPAFCYQPFFKIKLIHLLADDAADRYRSRISKGNAEHASTGYIGELAFLAQEFQHSEVLGIMLYLIEEDKCV